MHREQWASKAKNRIYLTATKRNDKRRGRCRKLVQGGGHEGWYSWPAENGEYWLRGSPGGILVVEGICSVNVGLNGGGLSWGVEERRHRPRVVFVLALGIARSGCVCRACVPRLRSCTHAHFCVYLQCTVAEPVYALAICTWRSRWLTNKREGNRVVKTTKIKEKRKKEYTIRRKITSLATYVIFRKIIYLRKFELTWERSFVSVQFVVRNESDLRQTRVSCGV